MLIAAHEAAIIDGEASESDNFVKSLNALKTEEACELTTSRNTSMLLDHTGNTTKSREEKCGA